MGSTMAAFLALLLLLLVLERGTAQLCTNTCTGANDEAFASDGDCDDGGPGAEFIVAGTSCPYGSDCADCGYRSLLTAPEPPPLPRPPPPSPPSGMPTCAEAFPFSAYDREACQENIDMLPIDIGVGGGIMLLLVLPNLCFYFGLVCKRWKKRPQNGRCPFTNEPSAHNKCRVCGTRVSNRAFVSSCTTSSSSTSGGVTTTTISTTYGWDHCVGCHFTKCFLALEIVLIGYFGLWVYTIIERSLAVSGATYRDERIRSLNVTIYALGVILALFGGAYIWCSRKLLLQFTCLTPLSFCCSRGCSSQPQARTQAVAAKAVPIAAVVAEPSPRPGGVEMASKAVESV